MLFLLSGCWVGGGEKSSVEPANEPLDTNDTVSLDSATPEENQSPVITVQLEPSEGLYLNQQLFCDVTAEDPEDGLLSKDLSWRHNGLDLDFSGNTFYVNAESYEVNDVLTCIGSTADSEGAVATAEATVIVEAKPISLDVVSVENASGDPMIYNDDSVVCSAETNDPDAVPILTYAWSSGPSDLGGSNTLDLSAHGVMPGDEIVCTVTAETVYGGFDSSEAGFVVDNRPPLAPTVTVTPAFPRLSDDLTCTATDAEDPDGELLVDMHVEWTDGNSTVALETLSSGYTSEGDEWTCEAYGQDGFSFGEIGSVSVEVLPDCDYNPLGSIDIPVGNQTATFSIIPGCRDPLGRYELTNNFYLMTTEVTQGMYENLVGSNPVLSSSAGYGTTHPVHNVTWSDAAHFANLMTQAHNQANGSALQLCYQCGTSPSVSCYYNVDPNYCTGYSLPTSAEWEYAARSGTVDDIWTGFGPDLGGDVSQPTGCGNGGSDTTILVADGVFDPSVSNYAWFCGNENDSTYPGGAKPVGLKNANGFDLYDMHGNLSEWVTDDVSFLFALTYYNPVSMGSADKVLRGGHWGSQPGNLGSAIITSNIVTGSSSEIGFRLRRLAP